MTRNIVLLALTLFLTLGTAMSARADLSEARAEYLLGHYAKAMKEYKAEGSPQSCYLVGYMYDHGEGVPQDGKAAAEWYLKAADKGVVEAQYRLGVAYANGYGVERDLKTAEKWYKKAAAQGFVPAKEALMNLKSSK